jgi:hypothetical protein
MRRCQKCHRPLPPGSSFYQIRIALQQGFDGEIDASQVEDLDSLMQKINDQTAGVPEKLLEGEVHREFRFLLCPRCKEKYCANPLNLPLDKSDVPQSTSDLDD